jgi:hypothetical protein
MSFYFINKKISWIVNIAFVVLLITVLIPNKGKFKYEYQRGRPWLYETLVAPVDFPILKSDSELRNERNKVAAEISPNYNYKPEAGVLLATATLLKENLPDSTASKLYETIENLYRDGIADELPDSSYTGGIITLLSGGEKSFVQQKKIVDSREAYTILKDVADELYPGNSHIVAGLFPSGLILPNMIHDNNSTQKTLREEVARISPTKGIIYSGQLIVSNGEIITAETEQILDSFRAEYELSMGFSGSLLLLKLGHLIVALAIILVFLAIVSFLAPEISSDPKSMNFLFLLFILIIISSSLVMDSGNRYLLILPYSVVALYLYSFFRSSVVIPVYSILLMPVVFISSGGFEIYFINLVAGSAASYTFRFWDRGWLQFINSIFIFLVLSVIYSSLRLVEEGALVFNDGRVFLFFAWNSLLVIAAYPFLFLFEKIFGLVSNSRLRDLSDATSPLLTRLAVEAPGTFHHSLQVASLAESAAREIGANLLLTRVGALYHDIGKLSNPSFFIENIPAGEVNAHKTLTPEESATVILRHVDEGVTIAKKMRIPSVVSDFILTHHGKSQTVYFYNQYVNQGGDPSMIDKFTYKGNLPLSKEQVIVMMADAVEAASRTLASHTKENISRLVDKMIDDRINENQLAEADVTIKEINTIREVMKLKLSQSYHARIVYPDRKR